MKRYNELRGSKGAFQGNMISRASYSFFKLNLQLIYSVELPGKMTIIIACPDTGQVETGGGGLSREGGYLYSKQMLWKKAGSY